MNRVLSLIGASAALIGAVSSAQAADMPLKAPPPPPAFSWTGSYIGEDIDVASSKLRIADNLTGAREGDNLHPHFSDPDLAALLEYAREIGIGQPRLVNAREGDNLHPHFSDPDLAALHGYAPQIGLDQPRLVSAREGDSLHPHFGDPDLAAVRGYAKQIGLDQSRLVNAREGDNLDLELDDADLSALLRYAQLSGAGAKTSPSPKAAAPKREPAGSNANYLGGKACLACHASQTELYNRTQMGRLKTDCETCHGPGGSHVQAVSGKAAPPVGGRSMGGIISFRKNDPGRTAAENNQICLGCHDKGNRVMWQASTHETRGLACTDCHTVMKDVSRKSQLRTAFEPDTCAQCHKNKRAEIWRTSHMPVREGKMTCGSCHNPHGTPNESLLKRATVNDTCYQCHAEKRGPFLFEHAPVRESCLNCHDPHGSVNDFMLKVSRPRACQQCHGTLSGHPGNPRNPQSVYALNRECQNCHSQVHGSNSPSGMRLMR